MTFRLGCPVCGKRDIHEFTFGGQERGPRPDQEALSAEQHFRWTQFRRIPRAPQEEWWYHGQGCGVWFRTRRDPETNREVEERGDGAG